MSRDYSRYAEDHHLRVELEVAGLIVTGTLVPAAVWVAPAGNQLEVTIMVCCPDHCGPAIRPGYEFF